MKTRPGAMPGRVARDPGPGPTPLLHDDSPLLVVPWLPDAHDHAVRLNLVDVAPLDPHVLDRRRRNDWRSGDYRRRRNDDRRRGYDGIVEDSAHDPAYEAWPEVAPATTPEAMVVVVVRWRRPEVRTGTRTPVMSARAVMRTR